MKKKIVALVILLMVFYSNFAFAAPGLLTGAYDFKWFTSIDDVRKVMRNRDDITEKIHDKSIRVDGVKLTELWYAGDFAGHSSIIYMFFCEDKLYRVYIVIPVIKDNALATYTRIQNMLVQKYGMPDMSSDKDNIYSGWNFEGAYRDGPCNTIDIFLKGNPLYKQVNPGPFTPFNWSENIIGVSYSHGTANLMIESLLKKVQSKNL